MREMSVTAKTTEGALRLTDLRQLVAMAKTWSSEADVIAADKDGEMSITIVQQEFTDGF